MYFAFTGSVEKEKIKIPEEIAKEIPAEWNAQTRDDYIYDKVIYNDKYYGKVISQPVGEFLSYYYVNQDTQGGYPIYETMETSDLIVCVVGSTRDNEAHINMFAYRKKQKASDL